MQELNLREIFQKDRDAREREISPQQPDPGWRRYLSVKGSDSGMDEFLPSTGKTHRSPLRTGATVTLALVVGFLLVIVSKEVAPLTRMLPATPEEFRAVLADLKVQGDTPRRKTVPPSLAQGRHKPRHSGSSEPDPAPPPLPPYRGVIEAALTTTPLSPVRPFKVDVVDSKNRHNQLEVRPKPVDVDIVGPEAAILQQGQPQSAAAVSSTAVELYGPEADAVAEALKGERREHSVGVFAVIGKDGNVTSVRRVNGSAQLAQAAIDTVRRTRYAPFLQNGHPVEMQASVKVRFSIPVD